MTTPEILTKAADVIDERGWYQGHYTDPDGRALCLVGAISVAAGLAPDAIGNGSGTDDLHAALAAFEIWLSPDMGPVDWNDEVAEDAAEVTGKLRECAASLTAGAR